MKQLEVTILGQSYILGCRDAGKVKARERIAVLAALNLAYQLADRPHSLKASPSAATSAAPDASSKDIGALITRIDAALGDDGHLL